MWISRRQRKRSCSRRRRARTCKQFCGLRAIKKSDCYHKEGHAAPCSYGDSFYMLFGTIEIVFSQIPNFHNMEWLSILAAIMSFSYSLIGFALGLAKVIGIVSFGFALLFGSVVTSRLHEMKLIE